MLDEWLIGRRWGEGRAVRGGHRTRGNKAGRSACCASARNISWMGSSSDGAALCGAGAGGG
eukprot:2917982-Pyramimonas_sp.AAC.1